MKAFTALVLLSIATTVSATVNEPPNGKVYLAAWLDSADSAVGAKDGDRPVKINSRLGYNLAAFQYAQNLPIETGSFPFPDDQMDETKTDAIAFLTVYPRPDPWNIADAEIDALANQCSRLNKEAKRRIILRFAPEMNGNWNYWGQQPTNFIALWKRVFNAVRAKAPETAFAWSPNVGTGYPFGVFKGSAQDLALLDTNKNGRLDAADDPYGPFYPGDEYVDWVGLSIYTYGSAYPWSDNILAPRGKFELGLNDGNFNRLYSIQKNKPMMISETAAAYHTNTPLGPGVGELATKRSWWQQFMTNTTFLQTHPNVKLICMFEFIKFEETFANGQDSLRDFRITNKTDVLNAFIKDFDSVKSGFYLQGNNTDPARDPAVISSSYKGIEAVPTKGPEGAKNSSEWDGAPLTSIALISLLATIFVTSSF